MAENQFMIHTLNILTTDYDLELALMERRVGDADKTLTVEEVRAELNLRFERMNVNTSRNVELNFWKNKLYSVVNSKENVEIVVKLGTSHFNARTIQTKMVEIAETELGEKFAHPVAHQAMKRRFASISRRRKLKTAMPVILTVTLTGETTSHKMRFSRRL
jgi:hypothetical protein